MQALASLAGLPSRQADDADLDRRMYQIALDGVSRYALNEAVKAIIRGGLGHTFFPSPVELRMQCDKAMAPHIEAQRQYRRMEAQRRENQEIAASHARKTPQAMARAKAVYDQFCASYEAAKNGSSEPSVTLDPELLARVPDAPSPFSKARVA